jgi:hypothetical protein
MIVMHGELRMRRALQVIVAIAVMLMVPVSRAAKKPPPNPADYTVRVHVSSARFTVTNQLGQILTVVIGGKHYEITGGTSSARIYGQGNGLLSPGDYMAKLSTDVHKTPFESLQSYELLLPDGTTRVFDVILQGE